MQARKEEPAFASTSEQPTDGSRLGRWTMFLREAVVGSQRDFTEGPIGPAIFLLAVPMVLEMMTESLLTMVFAVAMGLSMATTATVARRIGEKDPGGASVAAFQSIILGVIVSIPV